MVIIRFALILALLAQAGWPQGTIRLKTRTLTPATVASHPGRLPTAGTRHYLVLFQSYPDQDVLDELASRNIRVLSYVPVNGLMVSAVSLNLQGLGATWSGPMDPADKISPVAGTGAYLVIFQPDTDMTKNQALLEALGFTVIPNSSLLAGQLVVSGAHSGLPVLAALDQVAYILPASVALASGDIVTGCPSGLTAAGPVAQYVQMDSGWSKDATGAVSLQYYFDSLTPKITESLVRSEVARAFAEWASYTNISITPATAPQLERSIDILFARYAHGDAYPFDGPGGMLAHTFYPTPSNPEPLAGDMHLDADESWTVGAAGTDLYSVVLHETGHALGLGHSDNPTAVMYPYYQLQTGLTPDDIAGIQAIYGVKTQTVKTPPSGSASTGSTGGAGTSGTSGTGSGSTSSTGSPGTGTGTGSGSAPDTVPPTLSIQSPSSTIVSVYTSTVSVSGIAGDNTGVASVQWSTSTGGSGTATGTTAWSAVIPVLVGDNVVTIRAYDAAGNSNWRAITVVRN